MDTSPWEEKMNSVMVTAGRTTLLKEVCVKRRGGGEGRRFKIPNMALEYLIITFLFQQYYLKCAQTLHILFSEIIMVVWMGTASTAIHPQAVVSSAIWYFAWFLLWLWLHIIIILKYFVYRLGKWLWDEMFIIIFSAILTGFPSSYRHQHVHTGWFLILVHSM